MSVIWLIITLFIAILVMCGLDIICYRNAKRKQCRNLTETEEVKTIFEEVGSEKGENGNG